jgi:hypothetical protein
LILMSNCEMNFYNLPVRKEEKNLFYFDDEA